MAPILSFTAEEIWQHAPKTQGASESVFMSAMPKPDSALVNPELAERWDRLFKERGEVLRALEAARAAGIIGHSLDAKVVLYHDKEKPLSSLHALIDRDHELARDTLIVSQVELSKDRPAYLDQLSVAQKSGERGTYVAPDLPDGRKVCAYDSEPLGSSIAVLKADGKKCERCWKYDSKVGQDHRHPTVCPRCARVLSSGA
jgi:isoleucyl-tRNA synthetase